MQKAHLYEAVHLVNRGIDDAIRGLERLKRAKVPSLKAAYFDEKLTLLETHRALLNGYFCNNMDSSEQRDEARFAKLHREYERKLSMKCRFIRMSTPSRRAGGLRESRQRSGS